MIDYMFLGSAPADEECAQVGTDEYADRARVECIAYKKQIARLVAAAGKEIPAKAAIITKGQSHDYGTYYEVAVRFDDNDADACDFAYWLEEHMPGKWDDEARAFLFEKAEDAATA